MLPTFNEYSKSFLQAMEIWTKFLEPFLHLAARSLEEDLMDMNPAEVEEVGQKDLMSVTLILE